MRLLNHIGNVDLLPAAAGWLFTVLALPAFIALMRKLQVGQYIREEGPSAHAGKADTPTMGGVCFWLIICAVSAAALTLRDCLNMDALVILAVSSFCALLGLIDDLTKYISKSNTGVSAWLRLVSELCAGGMLGAILLNIYGPDLAFRQLVGNIHGHVESDYLVLPIMYYIAAVAFVFAGTVNAMNLHDGLDGLAAGTSWQVLLCLAVMLQLTRQPAAALIAAVAAGSVLAFLIYNRHPAKIFMGDVGSLFLGALMAALAITGHLVLWFVPLALIYIVETLSVIIQVCVFKLTKPAPPGAAGSTYSFIYKLTHRLPGQGKRVFRMAPLHHHFEAVYARAGESTVVNYFWLAQFAVCLIVLGVFYQRFAGHL